MFGLGTIIPPRTGLGIIRKQLETELNDHFKKVSPGWIQKPVHEYKLVINNVARTVHFHTWGQEFPYGDGAGLSKAITMAVESKLENAGSIDLIVIDFTPETLTVTAAYQIEGKKEKKTIQL